MIESYVLKALRTNSATFGSWADSYKDLAREIGKEHFLYKIDGRWGHPDNGSVFYKNTTYRLKSTFKQFDKSRLIDTPTTENKMKVKVIFNGPATVVFWSDNTKTIVKCNKDDEYDREKAFLMAHFQKSTGMSKKQVAVFMKEHCGESKKEG